MNKKDREEDLKIEIGTKAQANWKNILEQAEELVLKGESDLIINRMIVDLAKGKIEVEKEKV